ncbi:MAG: iron ABC transporter permease [Proteobacteria bacterium]|nr:iron ABC transporter permease [Pseudomonadota bacterium]
MKPALQDGRSASRSQVWKQLWLTSLLFVTAGFSLMVGGSSIGPAEVMALAWGEASDSARTIVLDIRLPRILLAMLVGAGVAASGAVIQGLFRNPLADPALIGVSAGAALFASLFMLLGGTSAFAMLGLAGSAFTGGLLATWIVLIVGQRGGGISTMLLAGIALNAIALSGVGLLSYLSSDVQLRSISFWALGSLNGASWSGVIVALVIPVAIGFMLLSARALNIMTLGEEEARYLGVSQDKLRVRVILLSAVAVGVGVALTGVIAFLGLIVPHLVRMMVGARHEVLIPGSALLGAFLLVLADLFSRSVFAPAELPVGILTALIGGPFFIYLIVSQQKERLTL